MIEFVEQCFAKAERLESKISQEIKDLDGMTGEKTRHFYNNLASMPDARVLEIGCWKGSSSCSFMFGNEAKISLIDDFSGFGSPVREFLDNLYTFQEKNEIHFYEEDCFKFDIAKFEHKFNIYLYDGDHSEASQFKGIDYYLPALEDTFILIVDDWNWGQVRSGTYSAIMHNNLEVLYDKCILTSQNNDFCGDTKGWWNGIAVFILKKP